MEELTVFAPRATSEWSESEAPQCVSHICLVCSREFQQKRPVLQFPEGATGNHAIQDADKLLDEFDIFFGLQCLSLKESVVEKLFRKLVDSVGEPGSWGVSFCPHHAKIVKKAMELDFLIKKLNEQLENMRQLLVNSVTKDLENENDLESGNEAFRTIRDKVRYAHSDIKPTNEEVEVEINLRRSKKRKQRQSSTIEESRIIEETSDPPMKEEIQIEPDDDDTAFGVSMLDDDEDLIEIGGNSVWKNALEDEYNEPDDLQLQDETNTGPITRLARMGLRKRGAKSKKPKPQLIKRRKLKNSCKFCPMSFASSVERDNHSKAEHGPKPYICDCGLSYTNAYSLNYHKSRLHKPEGEFQCDKCIKVYTCLRDLNVHKNLKHSPQATKVFNCPHCPKLFTGTRSLRNHINSVHEKKRVQQQTHLICELCSKTFKRQQDFKNHQAKVHFNIHATCICDQCGKELADEKSLKKHKLSQHLKNFQFHCYICGSGCLFKSNLIAHLKKSHGVDFKESMLTRRNISAQSTSHPSRPHSYVQTTNSSSSNASILEPPHGIPIIPSSQNLQSQINQILKGPESFECFQCGMSFCSSALINKHKRSCDHVAF